MVSKLDMAPWDEVVVLFLIKAILTAKAAKPNWPRPKLGNAGQTWKYTTS